MTTPADTFVLVPQEIMLAWRKLSVAIQTSGGVAGRDDALMMAYDEVARLMLQTMPIRFSPMTTRFRRAT